MKQLLVLLLCLSAFCRFSSAQTAVCKDSSTTVRYFNNAGSFEIRNQNSTRDNGLVAIGYIRNTSDLSTTGFIVKLDADKNVSWGKRITTDNDSSTIQLFDAQQFSNGSVIAAGILTAVNKTTHSLYQSIVLYRFSSAGALIWQKNVRSQLAITGILALSLDGINEGRNNEILLSSHEVNGFFGASNFFSILKIDMNGNMIWSHGFSNSYTDYSDPNHPTFVANTAIISSMHVFDDTLFCIGGSTPLIFKLNYTTGKFDTGRTVTVLSKFTTSNTEVASEVYSTTALLKNKLFAFASETQKFTAKNDMYSIVFDEHLNVVRSLWINALNIPYTPFSSVRKNIANTYSDTLLIGLPVDNDLYFSAVSNTGKIIQERRITDAMVSFGYVQKNLINGNSAALAVVITQNPPYLPNGFELFQLQDYGKSFENCIGVNDPHIVVKPLEIKDTSFSILDDEAGKYMALQDNSIINELLFSKETVCKQVSICDSVKIKGPSLTCTTNEPVIFTVTKRTDCLKRIFWEVDSSAISGIQEINDTTIAIKFKKEWTGYVYASISACTIIKDSFKIAVHSSPAAINLGNDTTFCTVASKVLNAKKGFKDYTWQDGSADSVFTASQTGKYYVTAHDYCDKAYTDSIILSFFKGPVVDLGKDTTSCEGQPVIFSAGESFKNYLWSTGAIISSIKVTQSGRYNILVTDNNNCQARDTVEILKMYPSPKLSLDKNSILCTGQSNTLHAGKGFTSYLWQDGSSSDTLTVSSMGKYQVKVTNEFGCANKDSVIIKRLYQSPADFLFKDSMICVDAGITLKTIHPFSAYLWSNHSTASTMQISDPGKYSLQVTDYYGCTGKDTVEITNRNCPGIFYIPNAFTPNSDGTNDIFKPTIDGAIDNYDFKIFNRWGQLLFSSSQINTGWDGNFKNVKQEGAVYTWVCSYKLKNKPSVTQKGTVILLK